MEEVPERAFRPRRQYKIQEVIKRRQVMLVQVVKEERGNKGAALTTYLSLAGRYAVLMPNTARGGGISRKITSAQDRSRLKEVVQDLDVPEGMGIILRTAGASRTKPEIKRDFEYLIRMWETVRDMTLKSQAPVRTDVNSGRSTREHHIEDTALKTNLEASEEVARQLRLRDLAGLIVIDFIDMDEKRNNRSVERKLSDCLRQDRARIQVGRISHFGLLEVSRPRHRARGVQRSTSPCPHSARPAPSHPHPPTSLCSLR